MAFEHENPPLFRGMDAAAVLAEANSRISARIDAIPDAEFRALSDEAIVATIVEEGRVQPITLLDQTRGLTEVTPAAVDERGNWCRLDDRFRPRHWRRGVRARVSARYEGVSNLWHFAPDATWTDEIRGTVEELSDTSGWLHVVFAVGGEAWQETLKERIDQHFARIAAVLEAQRNVVEEWNRQIVVHARTAIAERRRHAILIDGLPQLLEIPLVAREGRAVYRPVEVRRREVTPVAGQSSVAETEYRIGAQGYEQILHVCRHFGRSFEASPRPLRGLSEPEIRDLFLAALNTYFEGGAAGERFRREGFTDITIEEKSRAAFVSEFKLWKGPAYLRGAIDQLLDYTTWRDTKCAIVVFVRGGKDFAAVRATIDATLPQHRAFRRRVETHEPGEWRIMIGRENDLGEELTVHVFAFDIRTAGRRSRPPHAG